MVDIQSRSAWYAFAGLLYLGCCCSGCIYDHRVTQAIMARRQRAKAAEGAEIKESTNTRPIRYVAKLRVHVASDYRTQHTSWREDVRDLLDDASSVVAPGFGARFEELALVEWNPSCQPDDLAACLRELEQHDGGDDGAWVVGVLGSQPRFTSTFDELGLARVLGSHLLIRDVSDLAEREAIERAFATHTPGRRDEIYRRRKRHKPSGRTSAATVERSRGLALDRAAGAQPP